MFKVLLNVSDKQAGKFYTASILMMPVPLFHNINKQPAKLPHYLNTRILRISLANSKKNKQITR